MALLFRFGSVGVNLNDPFQNMLLLAILIVLTVIAYLYMVYRRGRRATLFGNMKTLEKVHGYRRFYVNPTVLIVKVLIISLLFLIATESLELRQTNFVADTDYLILLDSSSSMAKTDYPPSRLEAAREISQEWLRQVPDTTRVGFIAFSQDIMAEVPLTIERSYISETIDRIRIDYGKSGTDLDFALNSGLDRVNNSEDKVTFLLLTDGTQSVQNYTIAKARSLGVKVYAFGIGSPNETIVNESDYYQSLDFNFTLLQELSEGTGGKAYRVADRQELDDALREATLEDIQISLNTNYYVLILIAVLSILEFVVYSKYGGL